MLILFGFIFKVHSCACYLICIIDCYSQRYIDEFDLRRFLIKEEVDMVFPMIDVAETGQIDRKTLTEWVVCKTFLSFYFFFE